jgi:3-dehydroquinate synthase
MESVVAVSMPSERREGVSESKETVRVELGERSYDIEIASGNLVDTGRFVAQRGDVSHAVVITDENVEKPHGLLVAQSVAETSTAVDLVVIEPGELSKCVTTATELWERMLALGADRKTVIIAVGGGVIGDLAGFVAATYARGIPFFQVPTSLLAHVDSSVGGKVGINLPDAKNMVGAFLQPQGVFIDTTTLQTLPDREYRSGLAEVVKYGVILDAEFFDFLEANAARLLQRDHVVLRQVIARCCRLKADVVQRDEREVSGLRASLNYGHTFGHALESLTGYGKLLHGEVVAIGMVCASRLAERLGRIDAAMTARQESLLAAFGLPTRLPEIDTDEILRAMMRDKKVQHGELRFVLPQRLGQVELVGGVEAGEVLAVLRGE